MDEKKVESIYTYSCMCMQVIIMQYNYAIIILFNNFVHILAVHAHNTLKNLVKQ